MRKGELFALQKADVDFAAGMIMVARSHERDIPMCESGALPHLRVVNSDCRPRKA
jgi:hypothetical protein